MVNTYTITWNDYWMFFDKLCITLEKNDKNELFEELRDAQRYANGLTDGWFDFLKAFEGVIINNKNIMNNEENKLATSLISTLKQVLKKR